jgi:thiamine-monophosphate kinase
MSEHSLITRYFVPLAENFAGSLFLSDDAAILDVPAGQQLIITKDSMSEGVHFIGNEAPALIAKKLLRTNLSDLAAMGATPYCYFLSLALPAPLDESYIQAFASGLADDQKTFSIQLAGGDTITSKGTATFSITAHGLVPQGKALRRNDAKVGDIIYVSGTLGDSALGLQQLKTGGTDAYLINRYQLPQPRVSLGESLRDIATSCIDISDGLLADMNHICKASNVGADIHQTHLPLSAAAHKQLEKDAANWAFIYAGGDDYELLFTLPDGIKPPPHCTAIGRITQGHRVRLLDDETEITPERLGYSH